LAARFFIWGVPNELKKVFKKWEGAEPGGVFTSFPDRSFVIRDSGGKSPLFF
jgi:hypothetical protein